MVSRSNRGQSSRCQKKHGNESRHLKKKGLKIEAEGFLEGVFDETRRTARALISLVCVCVCVFCSFSKKERKTTARRRRPNEKRFRRRLQFRGRRLADGGPTKTDRSAHTQQRPLFHCFLIKTHTRTHNSVRFPFENHFDDAVGGCVGPFMTRLDRTRNKQNKIKREHYDWPLLLRMKSIQRASRMRRRVR